MTTKVLATLFGSRILRIILIFALSQMLFGCALVNYYFGRCMVEIESQALDDLRDGNLLAVRDRYEKRDQKKLKKDELAILCDIYIKHVSIAKADECLNALKSRYGKDDAILLERIDGKRALLAYVLGDYQRSAALTKSHEDYGSRYVYALAQARLGNPKIALDTANEWAYSYEPIRVFLAANLYLVAGRYDKALETLNDPERRIARDYSLSGDRDIFGFAIDPAPLKFDLFGEFGFGLLDTYSYAPQGNVYVEYVLAKSEKELGHKTEALRRFDKILAFPGIAAYRDVLWLTLYERGLMAESDGKVQKAIDYYKRSVEVIESARSSITTDAGKIGFVGDKQNVYASLIELLISSDAVGEAFEFSERARSRSLVDLLASVQQFGHHKAETSLTDKLVTDYERAEFQVLEAQGKPEAEVERWVNERKTKRRALLERDPFLASHVTVDRTRIADIQRTLREKEVILSYFKTRNGWRLFLIRPTNYRKLDLGNIKVDETVQKFREALQSGQDTRHFEEQLYEDLFSKAQSTLPDTELNLIIVPYGPLHYVPFSALYSKKSREYLIQRHVIRTVASASVLEYLTPEPGPERGILVLGNPHRPDQAPLPGADQEARLIASRLTPSDLFLGKDATKQRFLDLAPRHKYLHIAGHGKFDADEPLRSKILLAPPNTLSKDQDRSGQLTDYSIGNLEVNDLFTIKEPWDSRLVVLSACETEVSKLNDGDEMIGFERGFLYAGADSILGTLWRISDKETVYLMDHFYQALNLGASPAEALQKAQVDAIAEYWPPKKWAAFSLAGAD